MLMKKHHDVKFCANSRPIYAPEPGFGRPAIDFRVVPSDSVLGYRPHFVDLLIAAVDAVHGRQGRLVLQTPVSIRGLLK